MRSWTLGILMAAGLAMPLPADASPRDAVVAEAQVQPGADINEILEDNGWTVLALPSNMHLPGKLFKPGASSAEGTCIDATAVTGELPSIEAQGAKGFVVEAGGRKGPVSGSAGVQATSFQFKSITEVEQSVIEGFDMTLNGKCLQKLRDLQAKGTPIADWFVVQEVARARVKEVKCSSKEAAAEVRTMWIASGKVGAMSDCVESSEVTGVIAYKAKPVVDLMPDADLRMVDVPQVKAGVKPAKDTWVGVMAEADALMYIRTAQAFQKAELLYKKACESGLAEACAELAVILWWGQYNDGANRPRASNLMRSSLPALEVGCKQGNMRACLHLGHAWSDGIGVEEHDARGVALFEQSCTGGDARVYRKGEGVTKNASRAAELYEQSCTGGYAEGCYNLGLLYDNGEGVTKDKSRAAELYEQSCTGGDAIGCAHLGSQYRYGIGVTKNQTTAKRYFAKACGMGEEEACRSLVEVAPFVTPAEDPWAGVMAEADGFMYGRGVPKDREMAEPLYEKACEFGLAEACAELAVILWWGQRNDGKNRPKASNLMRSSLPALEVGCKQGNMRACLGLGTALDDGIGAEENDARAAALYEQSCTGGNAEGCYNLGEMYRNGEGVTKDLSRAAELVEQSCTGGYAEGCFRLGNVTKDKSRAAAFYEQSCTGGSAEGCFSLGSLYQYNHGVTKDLSRAAELYEQSCTGGNANGCNNLGKLYSKGEGVTKNQTTAKRYFAKACEMGDEEACKWK